MGDGLFSLMTCCLAEQPQPTKRRRRIDATMIGNPTDFRHTGHIGSGEMATKQNVCLSSLQNQMKSKGGYDHTSPVDIHLNVVDLPDRNNRQELVTLPKCLLLYKIYQLHLSVISKVWKDSVIKLLYTVSRPKDKGQCLKQTSSQVICANKIRIFIG